MIKPTTIEQMEQIAREEADGCCNTKIRGVWLEVKDLSDRARKQKFQYQWGKNIVSREIAINVLATA